ncbi:acyl-CoA dehydrogenase family protein [Paucisalibacillus globulus]|uniref:acyl-CoA dehydrogenase family protein n=1 Tax=Paucisalibacillus globulus TaxID=351095 RepID=UPI0003FC26BD|nr:acyl-CoA dehydrogenase family protein [Paucisalibacillus globulus]
MISFQATDEELAFVEVAKDFAKDRIRVLARTSENHLKVKEDLSEEAMELSFLSLELPEAWDGLELPLISQVQILKALSYGDLGIVQGFPSAGDAASLFRCLSEHTELQTIKATYLANTDHPSALVDLTDTEKPFGNTITVRNNNGDYILNGTTEPVRLAQFAETIVVFARDNEDVAVVLLLNDQEWLVEDGDYRIGLLASGLGKLKFNHVSTGKILAKGKEAERLIEKVQTRNYILQAAKQNGLMEAALDYATQYTAERKAFGQEIAKFQGVSFKIAKMAMETRIVNHLIWNAAIKVDEGSFEAFSLALRALHRAHKGVRFVTDAAVQLLGGHGFIQEFPVEKWMRDAQAQVALYGSEREFLARRGAALLEEQGQVSVE